MIWTSIALDVDNVLADTNATFCKRANAKWGTTFTKENIKYPKIIGSFRASPEHVFEIQEELWENWESLPPTEPDIGKIMETLRSGGKKITIATSRTTRSIGHVQKWLEAHRVSYDKFIRFGREESKSTIAADILVDDDQIEIGDFVLKKAGRIGLLYDQPWNRSILPIEGLMRIKSLKEIPDIFKK